MAKDGFPAGRSTEAVAKTKAKWYDYSDGTGQKREKWLAQSALCTIEMFELMRILHKECHHGINQLTENTT